MKNFKILFRNLFHTPPPPPPAPSTLGGKYLQVKFSRMTDGLDHFMMGNFS